LDWNVRSKEIVVALCWSLAGCKLAWIIHRYTELHSCTNSDRCVQFVVLMTIKLLKQHLLITVARDHIPFRLPQNTISWSGYSPHLLFPFSELMSFIDHIFTHWENTGRLTTVGVLSSRIMMIRGRIA